MRLAGDGPREDIFMRYWVKLAGKLRGPLEPGEIVHLPGVDPHTLLCPEGLDSRNRKNWRFARSFPELRPELERARAKGTRRPQVDFSDDRAPDPAGAAAAAAALAALGEAAPRAQTRPSPSRWLFMAAALVLLAALARRTPRVSSGPPPVAQQPARPGWQYAAEMVLPSCKRTLQEAAGGSVPLVQQLDEKRYKLIWSTPQSSEGIIIEYDEATKQLKPLTPAAQELLAFNAPCDKK